MQTLRRTRIGPFTAEQGIGLDVEAAKVELLPMTAAIVGMEQVQLESDGVIRMRTGQRIRHPAIGESHSIEGTELAVLDSHGRLVGIGRTERGWIKPEIVFGTQDPPVE